MHLHRMESGASSTKERALTFDTLRRIARPGHANDMFFTASRIKLTRII